MALQSFGFPLTALLLTSAFIPQPTPIRLKLR